MSYVTAADVGVTGLDLNGAHVALNRLKIAAARHLPDYPTFARFFVDANSRNNVEAYKKTLAPHLDAATRHYWEGRDRLGRKRIGYFKRNVYRQGLLGGFITAGHLLARAHRSNPKRLLQARNLAEQQAIFAEEIAPLFESGTSAGSWTSLRLCSASAFRPRSSRRSRAANAHGQRAESTPERLACGFDLAEPDFAWQAFGRALRARRQGPAAALPRAARYETLKARARISTSCTRPSPSTSAGLPRFLRRLRAPRCAGLDDGRASLQLWTEIARTARPGARHLPHGGRYTFPGSRDPAALLDRAPGGRGSASSIYGGFHLYVLVA